MREIHVVLGGLAIALNTAAALLGAWRYWRVEPSPAFWRLLRAGQATVVLEAALGGILYLADRRSSGLHVLYGVLPLLVAFLAEQLRAASADLVLAARGFEGPQDVGRLPEDEQRVVALSIVQRELGVMTLAALVIVGLLIRAATTGG